MTHNCELFRILSTVFSETSCFIQGRHTWNTSTKDAVPPIFISKYHENPIPLQRICVLSYLCLLLTKVLFETSFKSFQYNTEGRRLSNYSIKLILCSHYRSRCKGLCQNKKHEFDQYTKGGHFCAAHMALMRLCCYSDVDYFLAVITKFLCSCNYAIFKIS